MKNLPVIAKIILYFFLAVAAFDLIYLACTFPVASAAVDDALNIISLQVAEENCLDTNSGGKFEDSQYYSALKAMANNCPLWLSYNPEPIEQIPNKNTFIPKYPTNITQVQTKYGIGTDDRESALEQAIKNIYTEQNAVCDVSTTIKDAKNALTLSTNASATNDPNLYSYDKCPQRGQTITITLTGYYKVHLLAVSNILDVNIPITRSVTVVGMKFYKGKEG